MNGKFELFMCCLGNGVTVCNSAVMEHGDYKMIAHISDNGKIKYYVSEGYIPEDDLRKIEQAAEGQRQEFLSYWNSLSIGRKYEKLLDMLSIPEFLDVCKDKAHSMEEKVLELEKRYI